MEKIDLSNPRGRKGEIKDNIAKGLNEFMFLALDSIAKKELKERSTDYTRLDKQVKKSNKFTQPDQFIGLKAELEQSHQKWGHFEDTERALDSLDILLESYETNLNNNIQLDNMNTQGKQLLMNSSMSFKDKTEAAIEFYDVSAKTIKGMRGEADNAALNKSLLQLGSIAQLNGMNNDLFNADKIFGATHVDKDEESPTFGELIPTPEIDIPLHESEAFESALMYGDLSQAKTQKRKMSKYKALIEKNHVIGPVEAKYNNMKDKMHYAGSDLARAYITRRKNQGYTKGATEGATGATYTALGMQIGATGKDRVSLTRSSIPEEIKKLDAMSMNFIGSESIVKEIKDATAEKMWNQGGLSGFTTAVTLKSKEMFKNGTIGSKNYRDLDLIEKRKVIGQMINFTDTIDKETTTLVPTIITNMFRDEGAETDIFKDYVIMMVDSVEMLRGLGTDLRNGANPDYNYQDKGFKLSDIPL